MRKVIAKCRATEVIRLWLDEPISFVLSHWFQTRVEGNASKNNRSVRYGTPRPVREGIDRLGVDGGRLRFEKFSSPHPFLESATGPVEASGSLEIREGDQSPVGEINLTHKLSGSSRRPRVAVSTGDSAVEEKRGEEQEGLDVARIKISLHLCQAEEGARGYGGAYLRVIPEGRTPSAWDPTDNVSPSRATPPPYTGCRSRRIRCVRSRPRPRWEEKERKKEGRRGRGMYREEGREKSGGEFRSERFFAAEANMKSREERIVETMTSKGMEGGRFIVTRKRVYCTIRGTTWTRSVFSGRSENVGAVTG